MCGTGYSEGVESMRVSINVCTRALRMQKMWKSKGNSNIRITVEEWQIIWCPVSHEAKKHD